jgi:hypothetical protein
MSDLTFVTHDTAPSIFGALTVNGTVMDLAGATGVRFQMRLASERRLAVDGVADIITPSAGTVRYDWVEGDLSVAGDYVSRWQVTFGDGAIQHSAPENTITIEPE